MRRLALLGLVVTSSAAAQRGDTIVRQATRPVHAGVADLSRELAIGVADGDEHYMIGAIDEMAIGANGIIYVLDRSVPAIRMYDAVGKFVRNIGRSGSGPGEFRAAASITMAKNGNLLLWDPGNARINVYSPAGDVVTNWQTMGNANGSASGRRLMISDSSGTTYINTTIWPRDRSGSIRPERGWIRYDSTGKLRDTMRAPASAPPAIVTADKPGSFRSIGVPFAPSTFSEVSPRGYFVSGVSSRLAVELHQPEGRIVSIRRDVPPVPVTARERDSARADVSEHMRSFDPTWSWNGPDIPRVKAAYVGMHVASDGRIWVKLAAGPRFDEPATPGSNNVGGGTRMGAGRGRGNVSFGWTCPANGWALHDVFEPDGRYLGQVKTPEKVEAIVERGDYVWAATCNADDVPQVVRYRIAWK